MLAQSVNSIEFASVRDLAKGSGGNYRNKKKADRQGASPPIRLEASDVRSLQTLGTAGDFEFNRLAFVQRLVPIRLDSGKVDENVLAGLALDESIALAGVEPLHCSLFSH